MAEHAEETAEHDRGGKTSAKLGNASAKMGNAFSGLLSLAATAVRIVGAVFALILVIHIILFVFEADPTNGITEFFDNVAGGLALGFAGPTPGQGLFPIDNVKFAVLVNYGIAAIFWLVVAAIIARILQAVTPRPR